MNWRQFLRIPPARQPKTMASVVDAARRANWRGYFYFPTATPSNAPAQKRNRERSAADAEWLYAHSGAVRLAIDGLALDEVDTGLWPKADTTDENFNVALNEALDNLWGSDPRFFDAAKRNTYYSAQFLIRRTIRLHGELFAQLLRPGDGIAPRVSFIPGAQCGNADTTLDQSLWTDGIRLDPLGAPLQYRFTDPTDRKKFRDVNATDVLHFHDPLLPGRVRGESALSPVLGKLFSMHDIETAETSGTLLRTRIAYAVTSSGRDTATSLLPGVTSVEEDTVTQADGSQTTVLVQKIATSDGSNIEVADLPEGKDLKVIESNKQTAAVEWNKHLLADVAYATLYPPEYVYALAGMSQGTMVRLVQNRVQRIARNVRFFQLEPQFIRRTWTYFAWQLISGGYFANLNIAVPSDWWRMKTINPADMTVDLGREGRLHDERFESGKIDDDEYHGLRGKDPDDVDRRVIRRHFKRIQMLEEEAQRAGRPAPTPAEVWNSKAAAPPADNNDPPPSDPAK
jgi:hypothetical protein